jgi:hypothetical protein
MALHCRVGLFGLPHKRRLAPEMSTAFADSFNAGAHCGLFTTRCVTL